MQSDTRSFAVVHMMLWFAICRLCGS